MKKILSIFLAVLMLFGAVSMSASAATEYTAPVSSVEAYRAIEKLYPGERYDATTNPTGRVVVCFQASYGTYNAEQPVYNMDYIGTDILDIDTVFEVTRDPGYLYYQVPYKDIENRMSHSRVTFPLVIGTEEKAFTGWVCHVAGTQKYAAGDTAVLDPSMVEGGYITFVAQYDDIVPTSDVLETIINVLVKVFGSVVGFLFMGGDAEAGQNFLGGMIEELLAGM